MAESVSKPRAVRRTTKTAVENSTTGVTKSARKPKAVAKPVAEIAARPTPPPTAAKKPTAPKAARPVLVKRAVVVMPAAETLVLAHAEIAQLAYSYWLERGCQHGFDRQDWVRAERELLARMPQVLEKAS